MFQKYKDKLQHQQEDLKNENENIQGVEPDGGKGDASKLLNYVENKLSQSSVISPCSCNTKGVQTCQFSQLNNKIVYMGKCIGHSTNGSITYLAMDDDGKPVVAKKWSLPPPNDLQTRHTQFTSLKKDLKAMAQLSKSYLVPYAAMELKSESRETGELLVVFRDFIVGVSLKSLQDKCNVFDEFEGIRLLRKVGLGLFSALRELHSVGVLHRDVRSENVFLEDNGEVKLVGASLDARLSEIVEGVSYCDKQIKAQDIYAAALVLVSIVSKETGLEIPPNLPGSARDFFSRCLTEDENCQWPADQLVNHGFLTDALTKSPSNKNKEIDESECEVQSFNPYYPKNDNIAKEVQRSISTNLNSRLNDFEILDWLGKGAFGDVLKVKNKLDGRFYALKQVKIDPKNEELKKKITAEVELLSRLNHENVVRYYTAWFGESSEEIEGASEPEESSDQESSSITTTDTNSIVDYLVSHVKAHEDSSSYIQFGENLSSHNLFGENSSSHIQFGEDSNKSQSIPTDDVSVSPRVQLKEVLYIQMEFCEKNTLSQAINNGLHKDTFRAWRLFREILEGLAYIHQKGMIHRDLKPVNIFLDFNDNVKIGDFGLATRVFTELPVDDDPNGQNEEEMFLTGQVGTALYAAPELMRSTKVKYDQKVDMYSLGIILFEMFHPPFETFMGRYTVLTSLRNKKIIMPKSFIKPQNSKPRFIIRMLLNHDASRRPTSVDLLSSEHIPRVVPDETLSSLLAHALSRRSSRGYQMLIQGCLGQQVSAAEDFTFTSHLPSEMHHNHLSNSADVIQDRLIKVFKSHGAKEFSPPLLTPCLKRWEQNSNAVKVMTSSGAVCHLPYDLRLPFARYIAHSGVDMRRYAVGRVYRESKRRVRACHPVEEMQCAFDIITTGDDTLWPDAELLVVASRAAAECSLKVTIQLNHTDLLRSLLLSCGVPLDRHHTIYHVLADFSLGLKTRLQLQTHLETLDVSSDNMKFLLRLMKGETTWKKIQDLAVKVPVDHRPSFYEAVKQLYDVINYAGEFGCEFPMKIRPSLAYNATQHSGVFWQLSAARDQRPAKHRSKDLIAAGGRYDALVQEFRKVARGKKDSIAESKRSYVGFSIILEQMNTILTSLNVELPRTVTRFESPLVSLSISATVGDASYSTLAKQRARLARELWARGYSCITNLHSGVQVNIILLPDVDHVRVSYLENNTWSQEMIPFEGVLKFMNQKYNPDSVRHAEFDFTIATKRKRRSSWQV